MIINSQFDGGNIECIDCSTSQDIRLAIKPDRNSGFLQWFYFRLSGAKGMPCRLRIINANQGAYLEGWENYRVVASYDRQDWFRIETYYGSGELSFLLEPAADTVYFAYFAPYSLERLANFCAELQQSPLVESRQIGLTLDGRPLDSLTIGTAAPHKKNCWVIARQHPGETMASWWMEGFLQRLVDSDDPIARQLLEKAVFHVVPLMNPDGSFRGHLRTNAAGIDLNRQWQDASLEKSPEVFLVRQAMEQNGVNFCLDVHGDEALPYNFIAGSEGIPAWNDHLQQLNQTYKSALMQASPDFQTVYGYPIDAPGKANLALCTNYIAQAFNCLAMTLEMPFKDTADTPNFSHGWSPSRCQKLGAANLDAIYAVVERL